GSASRAARTAHRGGSSGAGAGRAPRSTAPGSARPSARRPCGPTAPRPRRRGRGGAGRRRGGPPRRTGPPRASPSSSPVALPARSSVSRSRPRERCKPAPVRGAPILVASRERAAEPPAHGLASRPPRRTCSSPASSTPAPRSPPPARASRSGIGSPTAGDDLLDERLEERHRRLAERVPSSDLVPRVVTSDAAAAEAFLRHALEVGHEGVMAKSLEAPYAAGSRGAEWLKIKPSNALDLVVLAAEWGSGRRRGFLSNL